MSWFLWVYLAFAVLSVIGKLSWLASGEIPARKPSEEAFDVFINAAMCCWALVLLFR